MQSLPDNERYILKSIKVEGNIKYALIDRSDGFKVVAEPSPFEIESLDNEMELDAFIFYLIKQSYLTESLTTFWATGCCIWMIFNFLVLDQLLQMLFSFLHPFSLDIIVFIIFIAPIPFIFPKFKYDMANVDLEVYNEFPVFLEVLETLVDNAENDHRKGEIQYRIDILKEIVSFEIEEMKKWQKEE